MKQLTRLLVFALLLATSAAAQSHFPDNDTLQLRDACINRGASGTITITGCGPTHDNGLLTTNNTLTTAAPSTTRSIIGTVIANYAGSVTPASSGSLVGVRGAATIASGTTLAGAYVYGTQGKLIVSGTMAGSAWAFGLVGQLDISAATLTSGSHIGAIWGDAGATGPSAAKSFADLMVLTNTTATTFNSVIYAYSKSSYVFDFTGNTTPFALTTSGTSAGQCKQNGLVPSKAMPVKIDGTDYWIPLCTAL